MTQGNDYLFAIQDPALKFWKMNPDGWSASLSNAPYFLKFAPDGWVDIAVQNVRNKTYKAIDRAVSVPLSHVEDGAQILKNIAYGKGLKQLTYLSIFAQELLYYPAPVGSMTGGPGLNVNADNVGTFTIPAGFTGYVKVKLTSANSLDTVYGYFNAGTTYVNVGGSNAQTQIIPIVAGTTNWNLFFYDTSGGVSTCTIELVNEGGYTVPAYGFWYRLLYRGEIDWKTFDHAGTRVTCTTLEDGLPKYLKAGDKTVHEFPMNVPDAVWVKYDGIKLHETLNYIQPSGFEMRYPDNIAAGNALVPTPLINNEGNHVYTDVQSQELAIMNGTYPNQFNDGDNYLIKNTGTLPEQYLVEGVLEYRVTDRNSANFNIRHQFIVSSNETGNLDIYEPQSSGTVPVGTLITRPYSFNITLDPKDRLYFNEILVITGSSIAYEYTENSKFSIKFTSKFLPSYARAFRPQYLWSLLVDKVTSVHYQAAMSKYFDLHKDKVWLSGNSIRQFDDATLQISMYDFFRFWDCIDSVGLVDRKGKFVDFLDEESLIDEDDVIMLGSPAEGTFKVTTASDQFINEIEIGFPDIRNDVGVLNGRDEFNAKTVFSTEATTLTGKLDAVAPVSVSCYDQEGIRVFTTGKNTTDYKNDNKCYVVHIEQIEQPADPANSVPIHYKLNRDLNATVTAGLLEPETVFNLWFTPARSIDRKGLNITGRFYLSDDEKFFFRSSDKNKELVCNGVVEKADFVVGQLKKPKHSPWLMTMELPPPLALNQFLDLNPLQTLAVEVDGNIFKGTLERIGVATSKNNNQVVEMRSLASNDHTKFIRYYGGQ